MAEIKRNELNNLNTNSHFEIELKLHVPQACSASFEKALRRGAVQTIHLRAMYFDTPERQLARQKVALRLRLENNQWVQTLKMSSGNSTLMRIELNHVRPSPELDLAVYTGSPAESIISTLNGPLTMCYEVQVLRLMRHSRIPSGTVEIAYDTGFIRSEGLELPLREVEFELKRGDVGALFAMAAKWQREHGLVLDARSKSERGDLLAKTGLRLKALELTKDAGDVLNAKAQQIEKYWTPRNAKAVQLMPNMSADQALRLVMAECLDQIVRNSAVLAEIDTQGVYRVDTTEHVHQLRVGIRRMRTAWSVFNGLCALPSEAQRAEIKTYFSRLGGSRDNQVLFNDLLPSLQAAGQPALMFEADTVQDDSGEVVKDPLYQSWLLRMCEFVNTSPEAPLPPAAQVAPPPRVKKRLMAKLAKWQKKIIRDGVQFAQLEMQARHDLRKRVKKLRYAMQFADALLPVKGLNPYLKGLSQVQNILGDMNDLYTALEKFSLLRDSQPSAWFACGWITHKLDQLQTDAVNAFQDLSKASYWD